MARKKLVEMQGVTEVTAQGAADLLPDAPLMAPASAPQVAGNYVPATMLGAGSYLYEPAPVIGENGRGEAIVGPYASLRWRWNNLAKADYEWIVTTVLQGQPSRTVTSGTTLYDHRQVLTEIASCVVMQPTYESLRNGRYINVEMLIKRIVEA